MSPRGLFELLIRRAEQKGQCRRPREHPSGWVSGSRRWGRETAGSSICVWSVKRPAPATAPTLRGSLFSPLGPIQGHFSACWLLVKMGAFSTARGSETPRQGRGRPAGAGRASSRTCLRTASLTEEGGQGVCPAQPWAAHSRSSWRHTPGARFRSVAIRGPKSEKQGRWCQRP